MRGLMNSCAPISGFVWPSRGQPGDLRLLGGEVVARLGGAPAHRLAGRGQLAAGALGERLRADAAEHLVRAAELLARVDAPVLAAQPLAVEQVRAREVDERCCVRPSRSIASRYSASAASPSLSSARERACIAERPARAGDARALLELRQRRGGLVGGAGPRARLDELGERPAEEPQILVLARAPGGGERGRVPAEPVVQHRRRVLGQADRPPLSAGGRVGDGRLDQLLRPWILSPRQAASSSEVYRSGALPVAALIASASSISAVGGRELAGVDVHAGPRRERERKDGERAGLAGQRHRPAGQLVPRLVVPQVGGDRLRRDGAGQPEPAHVVLGAARPRCQNASSACRSGAAAAA